jgi:hypothetical protein
MNVGNIKSFFINVWGTLFSALKVVILSRPTKLGQMTLKNNSKEKCLIIGNGPSLKNELEDNRIFFEAVTSICVNYFPLSDEFQKIKPNAIVLHAPEFWIESVKEEYKTGRQKLFAALIEKTSWNLLIYAPIKAKYSATLVNNILSNKHISITFYNDTPIEGFNFTNALFFNLGLGLARPHNVVIPSLILALRQNFKQIYLTGVDHSWLKEISVDAENNVLVGQYHFYDDGNVKPAPMNKVGREKTRNLAEVLEKFIFTFKSYYQIKEYANRKNATIYNATKLSFIDAFDRIDLKNIKI